MKSLMSIGLFLITLNISYSQTFQSLTKGLDSLNPEAYLAQLLIIKKQFPDSFLIEALDYDECIYTLKTGDTSAFYLLGEVFLRSENSSVHHMLMKTPMCKHLYTISKARKDTALIIQYAENRLLKYNKMWCYTGEKHFRLKLYDELIQLYTIRKNEERVKELITSGNRYHKKEKLGLPKYLKEQ
jgi:hypothetical protein